MAETRRFVITCEHGGNRIPPAYRKFFLGREGLLQTHRGYDAGALAMARELAAALAAPLFVSTTSRLLIDLNRSIGHPRLYSEATRDAPAAVRREILHRYYLPHRSRAEGEIAAAVGRGLRVIHIASHSFTPELDGEVRNADIGLLYDPARRGEADLCRRWQSAIAAQAPDLRVRRNYPYAGTSDGLTAYLRRRFPADAYAGIELEINQKHVVRSGRHWRNVRDAVTRALRQAVADIAGG
jgi:predicted N-formylglutamate amidohydrolase